jgi:hypothetical protein
MGSGRIVGYAFITSVLMQVFDFYFVLSSKAYAPLTESPFPYHRLPIPAIPDVATAHKPPHLLTPSTVHASHTPRQTRASLTIRCDVLGVFDMMARRVKKTQVAVHSTPFHFLQLMSRTCLVLAAD